MHICSRLKWQVVLLAGILRYQVDFQALDPLHRDLLLDEYDLDDYWIAWVIWIAQIYLKWTCSFFFSLVATVAVFLSSKFLPPKVHFWWIISCCGSRYPRYVETWCMDVINNARWEIPVFHEIWLHVDCYNITSALNIWNGAYSIAL